MLDTASLSNYFNNAIFTTSFLSETENFLSLLCEAHLCNFDLGKIM